MAIIPLVKTIDPIQALSFGAIGAGLVLGMLAFLLLLRKRQNVRPVYAFMVFALALVTIGSVNEYARLVIQVSVEAGLRAATLKQVEAQWVAVEVARKDLANLIVKIEESRRMAQGASTNTSDAHGATTAAYAASMLSQDAINKVYQLDSELTGIVAKGS